MQAFDILLASANSAAAMDAANAAACNTDQNWAREETIYTFDDGSTLVVSGSQCNAYPDEVLPVYEVDADAATGEWLGEPAHLDHALKSEWDAKIDTDAVHYDTYEHDGETRAIKVNLQ